MLTLSYEQNLLNNFHASDVLTVAAKVFLFFQMMTVFPLIMYLLRVSVLYPLFQTVWPGEITKSKLKIVHLHFNYYNANQM